MKAITSVIILFTLITFSTSYANDSLKKAYSLYYKGKMKDAIKIMDEYVAKNPDPKAMYFIGYAYYRIGDIENARRYFKDAYLIEPRLSPVKR